jgi:hypothetical protein
MRLPNFNRRRQRLEPVRFEPATFTPQVRITMTRDVTGWTNRERRIKYHLRHGRSYMVDGDTAVDFITKGYATGELPRSVSDDERAELRSQNRTIGLGG